MSILANQIITLENIDSIVHTVDIGTYTENTPINNLLERSLLKRYEFTHSASAFKTHTLTITLTDVTNVSLICVKDSRNISAAPIVLKDSGGISQTIDNLQSSESRRIIDGISYNTVTYNFDEVSDVKTIEVQFFTQSSSPVSDEDCTISGLYVSQNSENIKIKPTSLGYTFKTQGVKKRTHGGQVIASRNISYMVAKFTATATDETDVIQKYFNLNYESSVSEPLIFIPQAGENIMLYGTQAIPNTTKCLLAKNGTDWLYETSFTIEEEL